MLKTKTQAKTLKRFDYQIGVGGLEISDYEKQLVNEVLESNRLTYGPFTKKFEKDFSAKHDCRFGLYVNSGTSALHIGLQALKERHGWKDGDEVLVPAVTFVATSNIVLHNRMTPVFVDVELDTYNIDPTKIEEKITNKTRAIIPVHLLGLPASMGPIKELAKKHNLSIIEDSCETMFARYQGQSVGAMGDIGTFSTYVAHFLVTGVGGLATTNDPELARDLRSLMNHGRNNIYISCSDDQGVDQETLEEIISKRFSFERIGHSFRCTEMEAALGLGQLAKVDFILKRRREIADRFTRELADLQDFLQLPHIPSDRTHSFMLYGLTTKNEPKKNLVNYLESLNIETRDLLPLTNQPVYKKMFGNIEPLYPNAKKVNERGFYIGCHPYMKEAEVDFVIEAIRNYFST